MATYNDVLTAINTNLADGTQIAAALHRAVEIAILDFAESQWLPGDIKEIDCTDEYITANFTTSGPNAGLGLGEREGWAICNGNNGTRNRTGRVSVGYGNVAPGDGATTKPSVGVNISTPVLGGAETHVLGITEMPRHRHDALLYAEAGNGYFAGGGTGSAGGDGTGLTRYTGGLGSSETNNPTSGTTVAHNNMQPYIVTLFIQKLPNP